VAFVDFGDGVDEGAFAGVALADDGDHHFGLGQLGGGVGQIEAGADGVLNLVDVAAVHGGDGEGAAETEAGEVAEVDVGVGAVGFVGDEDGTMPLRRRRAATS